MDEDNQMTEFAPIKSLLRLQNRTRRPIFPQPLPSPAAHEGEYSISQLSTAPRGAEEEGEPLPLAPPPHTKMKMGSTDITR